MQLRSLLALAFSGSVALGTYACSDTTFPSQLPVYTLLDGTAVGLTDTGIPTVDASADGGEAGALVDGGDAGPALDAGDAGTTGDAGDAGTTGDASVSDAQTDASDDGG